MPEEKERDGGGKKFEQFFLLPTDLQDVPSIELSFYHP